MRNNFALNCVLFGLAAWAFLQMRATSPANAADQTPIGIIQYNVKGGQGGWTVDDQTRAKQVQLIVSEVKDLKDNAKPIDFITLEQADPPLLTDSLNEAGLSGWTTIASQCRQEKPDLPPDKLQLSYSSDWKPIGKSGLQNPMVDGYATDACWKWGRPYNIAYFHNSRTGIDILFVILHMPHCGDLTTCFNDWRVKDFLDDVQKVVGAGAADVTKMNLIVSGDMNELGEYGSPTDFARIFKQLGPLTKSANVATCCEDNGFSGSYDHFATNSGTISEPVIIANDAYPIDPRFNERHPDGKVHNEEHKAIYGVVTVPMP